MILWTISYASGEYHEFVTDAPGFDVQAAKHYLRNNMGGDAIIDIEDRSGRLYVVNMRYVEGITLEVTEGEE